jgi:hypothetical protein
MYLAVICYLVVAQQRQQHPVHRGQALILHSAARAAMTAYLLARHKLSKSEMRAFRPSISAPVNARFAAIASPLAAIKL